NVRGQAFTFTHRGFCYALVPKHVVGGRGRLSVMTGVPPRTGTADIRLRLADTDMALASVTGLRREDCGSDIDALRDTLRPVLTGSAPATLTTVLPGGEPETIDVTVALADYERIEVQAVRPGDRSRIAPGDSGALIAVRGVPVALGIKLLDAGTANERVLALRLDDLKARIVRFLSDGALGAASVAAPDAAVAFEVVEWSGRPLDPDLDPRGLVSPGGAPFVAEHGGREVRLVLRLTGEGGRAPVVSGVRIEGGGAEGATAPKTLRLRQPRRQADPTPRRLNTGSIAADGRGTVPVSPRRMEWLEVTVTGVWDPQRPLSIETLTVLGE
ncbi:hypothetical protein, partial [Roseibium alexandrii]|uniref:hypothetical protein n=1 Tax=Roseibium alexandrii TaxID=388408 RepID=UPI000B19EC0A